ncbi:pulmonary surfactant-associated protein D [Sagmatias obliquidens]|uniref:pulmonary surfactant-associated protein D n=1 Tax=Sagmatias obliquidens TaxID=3371155 RepID=UPI000F445C8D|nr:pulmonary surfactant-associated protein D [Lagenorhynchus obliquidens]
MRRAAGIVTCGCLARIGPRSPETGPSCPCGGARGGILRRRGAAGRGPRCVPGPGPLGPTPPLPDLGGRMGAPGPRWPRLDSDPSSGPRGGGSPSSPPGAGGVGASGAPPRRPLRPQAAGQPKPSRMEVLDEFDSEFPQSVTFCQLIPEEDFERQAATYTESALRLLFLSLDRNPALDESVVRKGKQAECERRGLLSFLWVRAREGGAPGCW